MKVEDCIRRSAVFLVDRIRYAKLQDDWELLSQAAIEELLKEQLAAWAGRE